MVNKSYEYEGDERLQWENQAVYELKNLVENSEYSFTDEQIENMCRDAGVSFPYFLDVIGKNLDPLRAVG